MSNKNKKKNSITELQNSINKAKEQIQYDYIDTKNYIPNIIEFVESPKYLGFSKYNPPIELSPVQKIMLKVFYRGTVGNKNLELTEDEVEIIQKYELTNEVNGNVLGKYLSNNHFRELVLVWGRRCLSEDCFVVDSETGKIWTLGEMWDYGKIKNGTITYDEKQKKIVKLENCSLLYQGKRDVYKIETESGNFIEATNNHPFLTDKGWVEVKGLKKGESIAVSCLQPIFNEKSDITEEESLILGFLASSKSLIGKKEVHILTKNSETILNINNICKSLNKNLVIDNYRSKNSISDFVSSCKIINDNSRLKNNYLYEISKKVGLDGKSKTEKRIPSLIFSSSKRTISLFLKSLISFDGEVKLYNHNENFHCRINICLYSKDFAMEVKHLLSRFGINSSLSSKKNSNTYHYDLCISKKRDIAIFFNEIGLFDSDITEKIKEKNISIEENNGVIFEKIINITKIGTKRTFDISTSDEEHLQNFICNNFVCHNSGKSFITSIVALYEALKLLEAPGGNPHAQYGLSGDVPFTILTVANSSEQAAIIYTHIKEKMLKSSYFDDKYIPEGITSEYIYLQTPEDKKNNIKLIEKGLPLKKGSIQIRIGHSESTTLVGIDCFAIVFDEIGLYKTSEGPSSGEALYNNLTPALSTYVRKEPAFDDKGNPIIDEKTGKQKNNHIYDGKIVCISTPRSQEGIFFKLYSESENKSQRLMCRLPTWIVNPNHTESNLREEYSSMSEDKFDMEFGAKFSGTAGSNFFTRNVVDNCFRIKTIKNQSEGRPGIQYFAHLDPATSSCNYALCICHKEPVWNNTENKRDFVVIVDHIKYWHPSDNKPINVEEVDEYILNINKKFYLYLVTYDQWESYESIRKLRKYGIPAKKFHFNRHSKRRIYDNLEQLALSGRILIPDIPIVKQEMYNLQRKYVDNGGYWVGTRKDGDVTTDDTVDAIASASYHAMQTSVNKLPQGKVMNFSVSSNSTTWRSMQGIPYGYGPGKFVADNMRNRNNNPPFFR